MVIRLIDETGKAGKRINLFKGKKKPVERPKLTEKQLIEMRKPPKIKGVIYENIGSNDTNTTFDKVPVWQKTLTGGKFYIGDRRKIVKLNKPKLTQDTVLSESELEDIKGYNVQRPSLKGITGKPNKKYKEERQKARMEFLVSEGIIKLPSAYNLKIQKMQERLIKEGNPEGASELDRYLQPEQ